MHRCGPPGGGGPHAILRSRQKRHAMIGFFFSGSFPSASPSPSAMLSLNIAWPAAIVVVGAGGGMMEVVEEEEEEEGTGPTTPSASSPAIPEMEVLEMWAGPGGGNCGKG